MFDLYRPFGSKLLENVLESIQSKEYYGIWRKAMETMNKYLKDNS